jgi:hypothetical protein
VSVVREETTWCMIEDEADSNGLKADGGGEEAGRGITRRQT